ncbi:MAG TPA: DUF222 domain-containing protein [Acidimicrobiales bacterium]|jgi:hypothetical protein|nr:DUF222 domain-containing protein [Acidimicrobiales bacterium]
MQLLAEKTSTADLMDEAEQLTGTIASTLGSLMDVLEELDQRKGYRTEGATSLGAWLAQRCGISESTGRLWARVAKLLGNLPHLSQGLRDGAVSFDKVRTVATMATPETDADLLETAQECSVRQLADLAQAAQPPSNEDAANSYEDRYLRFNDARRTITTQLPQDLYAEVRAAITMQSKQNSREAKAAAAVDQADEQVRWDQRLADALVQICRLAAQDPQRTANGTNGASSGGRPRYLVVAHTPLSVLMGGDGLAELERLGLVSGEVVRRLACDARLALAVDDPEGHTMFEGRARRFPTPAQRREAFRRDKRCRFPGCSNDIFTDVHHITWWEHGGLTDLENLVTLCEYHHTRVHEQGWRMVGNANGVLTFVSPDGREMTSHPSPLWTKPRR